MRCSEVEFVAIEAGFRTHEQQQIFREVRFANLMTQAVARKADGSIDSWREYLNGELKALGFSNAEILAEINRLESEENKWKQATTPCLRAN